MPKVTEFYNTSNLKRTATKATESDGGNRSTSSAKYRVSSNLPEPNSADAAGVASRSPDTRLSTTNVSALLKRMSKNYAPGGVDGPSTGKNSRYVINTEAISPSKVSGVIAGTPKLPQKLRQHVHRLRDQFASGSASSGSSRNLSVGVRSSSSASPHKAPRSSISSATTGAKRFSFTAAAAIQYSPRSNQRQQLQATKHVETPSQPVAEAPKTSVSPESTSVNAGTFQDLLRPLQTSLSCASLSGGWSSDEEDEAEQLFRQSEREHSRMLRVCCSIDNLMQSIGDQAQEQKQPEAIVRGATRDLVKLFQFAMKQAVSVIFDKTDDQISNNSNSGNEEGRVVGIKINGKEAQYAMEFLLEINERIGKLYEFARSVFVAEGDGLRHRINELEDELAAATLTNDQLNNEMRDLRDFHEHKDVNAMDSFTGDASGARYPELDNRNDEASIAALVFPEALDDTSGAGDGEWSELKQQCQELSRLLEMAKQEIRLSHHERDVQKARVAEISSALFHDSELGLLRNQFQSEKKRVRVLERENLTLRESHQDQALKLQSLEALQTPTSVSGLTASSSTSASSVGRHSISASRPSIDTVPIIAPVIQPVESIEYQLSEGESSVHSNELTIDTQDNQYNFMNSGAVQTQEVTVTNWFSRIVNPPQPASLRKSRKKQTESKPEQQPPVALSKFLAGLLMTDKQLNTIKDESKVRRQGSVPSLIPPVRALSARRDRSLAEDRNMADKKRRPQSATVTSVSNSNVSRTSTVEAEDNPDEVVASCLQLIWVFYQRFLVAVEGQHLLATRGLGGDPTLGSGSPSCAGNPSMEPVSLSLIMFHFFLERCNRELDAARELEQFVRCLHGVRTASYSVDLFCQFLEETCSRQELCFYLWVRQAMNDVRLGIPYDDPLASNQDSTSNCRQDDPTKFICVLKATFLARTIFRCLHFKVLYRPRAGGSGKRRRKSKRKPINRSSTHAALVVAPISPSSVSPKRRPKTRLGELTAAQSPKADSRIPTANNGDAVQVEEKEVLPHVGAQTALRDIIENNQGEPITLETFNNLLLQYAVVPSPEELAIRLGPFYQPTGDERKIPVDIFIALLMETYKFQLQWQRDQLLALFIHLNHQEEVRQRAAEKLIKAETANGKGGKRENGDGKNPPKSRLKREKSRNGAADNGVNSKYLRGLSRSMLRELLLQSGIVHESDVAQVDMDWLFAELLQTASGVAADITFDVLYDALQKMKWLNSTKLQVDTLREVTKPTGMQSTKRNSVDTKAFVKARSSSFTIPSPMVLALRDKWRIYARHSLALCNNDPNVFVRRHSQRLLHYVDQELGRLVSESESRDPVNEGEDAIQCIREFLAFAWRVAAKRSNGTRSPNLKKVCLTEVFLVSQALRATVDSMPGYHGRFSFLDDKATASDGRNSRLLQLDALQSFYDVSRMNLQYIVKDKLTGSAASDNGSSQLQELENVLALYAAHIAHLFHRFSEARYNCAPQVSFHRWKAMVYELDLVDSQRLPFSKLQTLFSSVAMETDAVNCGNFTSAASLDQELGVGKTHFSKLFVLVAITRHRFALARKLEKAQLSTITKARDDNREAVLETVELADGPGRIMAQFCRDVIVPRAFRDDTTLVERNFAAKISCPLVGRALLEHRSFLRTVFFYYAKQDEVAADERAALEEQALLLEIQEKGGQINGMQKATADSLPSDVSSALLQPDPVSDFQLEKTKRSSMSFGEFQTFLTAFSLLDDATEDSRRQRWNGNKVALADAQNVFSSVMSLENDDTLQLEFDEFAAAMVALAVHLNPSPFTLWHQKLDEFATRLRRTWETINEGTISCFGPAKENVELMNYE